MEKFNTLKIDFINCEKKDDIVQNDTGEWSDSDVQRENQPQIH